MTAEELIRHDGGRSTRPKGKKETAKDEKSKPCPHWGENIPEYAEACKHCKKILTDYG